MTDWGPHVPQCARAAELPMIETFLFDLGGVLVRFSHERMFTQMAAVCGVDAKAFAQQLQDDGLMRDFERGRVDEDTFVGRVERLAGRSFERGELLEAGSNIFEPLQPSLDLVEHLKWSGFRMVLISNTCVSHFDFLRRRHEFLDWFDARVLSYEVNAVKPEPAIFEAALAAIDCPPECCLYIDDIAEYVAAGRQFGLLGYEFDGIEPLRREIERLGVACG